MFFIGGVNYVENFKGIIQIKDVSFSYPTKSSVNVLSKFNITVDSGDSIAIVGTSGGGKSTIISLLMRFYDVSDGIIYFDGIDVKRYDLAFLHSKIGLVSQEPILFSGTIEENITYGIPIYNKKELDSISKLANAYDFINDKINFPQGYKTLVGERGVKLSGGQKQRIAIARSLMRKPKILIFDEATSALDAENEALVQQSIESIIKKGGITLIVIAHRLSTIVNCKRIVVLDQGNIVEDGNHEELMGKNGVYKNLVGKQILTK